MKAFSLILFAVMFSLAFAAPASSQSDDVATKLREWRKGVWLLPDGSYAIYTDSHYFVLVAGGDSSSPNLYCGASQVRYSPKGMARKQVMRMRQAPGRKPVFFVKNLFQTDHSEAAMAIDMALFTSGTCNIKDGIIYDSITEATDEYILLSTCNGDKEKIFSNGTSVYMPAGGGEAYAYRIERLD